MYHIPVLLQQCVDGLNIQPGGTYVDVTFGGGGHSKAILEKLGDGRLIAFDQDQDATENIIKDERFLLVNQNFRHLKNFLRLHDAFPINGLLADLGISSHQIDVPERGFSSRFDAPLDMRMSKSLQKTAADIVNTYSIIELNAVFRKYGELKQSHCVAKAIYNKRVDSPIETTFQLADTVQHCFPVNKRNKFLAMIFQALRIEVNDELAALEQLLTQMTDVLVKGGRLVVMSYHSLEDRLVKNFMRTGNLDGKLEKDFYGNPITPFKALTSKPVVPDASEIEINSRARSAKLRIAEKL